MHCYQTTYCYQTLPTDKVRTYVHRCCTDRRTHTYLPTCMYDQALRTQVCMYVHMYIRTLSLSFSIPTTLSSLVFSTRRAFTASKDSCKGQGGTYCKIRTYIHTYVRTHICTHIRMYSMSSTSVRTYKCLWLAILEVEVVVPYKCGMFFFFYNCAWQGWHEKVGHQCCVSEVRILDNKIDERDCCV